MVTNVFSQHTRKLWGQSQQAGLSLVAHLPLFLQFRLLVTRREVCFSHPYLLHPGFPLRWGDGTSEKQRRLLRGSPLPAGCCCALRAGRTRESWAQECTEGWKPMQMVNIGAERVKRCKLSVTKGVSPGYIMLHLTILYCVFESC